MTTKIDLPSSSCPPPPFRKLTYDVFLSFRGTDTRTNFTDHLYAALKQKGIHTFRDDEELKRGESIAPNLLEAIEESRYAIVVFSQNYANSSWCLDELAQVAECRRVMGQTVLPVFYHVDPSDVRRQTGEHFGKAFEKHQERFGGNPNKLQRWKDALAEVGNLSGWHLKDGYESKVIHEIVEKIFTELNQLIPISEGLVGMDSHLNEMLSYLDIGCPDVRIIGICGMGGIGKTTIAQVVFERVQAQFEGCSFLENVREQITEKQGAVHLQQQLLSDLLKCSVNVQNTKTGKKIMRQRLSTKMVLIILDDVDKEKQLEALCDRELVGPGSRIIITCRDEHLLSAVEGDKVYKVNPLTDAEALQLFSMKAFRKDQLVGKEILKLSKELLKYAKGLPLAIEVLGCSVKGRGVELWSSALERLEESPNKEINNVLKVSFDGLEPREQKNFLDIACFLKGVNIDRVRRILQGSNAHCPDFDIQVLLDKSLVTLFGTKLWMHDLIQDMGREVVLQECEEPGKRSRLWLPNEIIQVLDRSKATSAVQSIFLEGPTKDDVVRSIDNAFSKMDKLRLLKISNVKFSGNITYLSNELQYLEWHECPLDSLPSDFQPEKLVEVHMYFSRIKQLWRGKKGWSMLRLMDLSGSQYLMSTPDFSEVPDLEQLVLLNCTSLVVVHPSLGFLKKLRNLDMENCKSIESLPPFIILESLERLRLSLCSGLKKFPEIEGDIKSLLEIHLDGTSIEELPPSIERLTGLTMLNLRDCKNLLHLPNTIGCLTSLKDLYLEGCSKIDEIPGNLNGMKCLEKLFIGGTSVRELSFILGMKNLQCLSCRGCKCLISESCKCLASLSNLIMLDLSYCNLMDGAILNYFSSLISLRHLNLSGNRFVRLPESICQLSKLSILELSDCRQLQLLPKKLPLSLTKVCAQDCTSLTDYPNQIKVLNSSMSGMTIVDSLNSSALGVSHSSEYLVLSSNVAESANVFLTYKNIEGEQIDQWPMSTLNEFSSLSSSYAVYADDEIPEWFSTISTRNPISISIPQNLTDDNKWTGFAACAIFSVKGHTALTLIEPDHDFLNYSYQITWETDVVRLEPHVLKWREAWRFLGSSSHLLVLFYLSRWKVPEWGLNQSTVVRAMFETTNPSMVVQKCGIRLLYEQDEAQFAKIFKGQWFDWGPNDVVSGTLCDYGRYLESDWLSQSMEREKFIPPSEEESTLVLRKNLESVLPRYLEALNCHSIKYKFNLRGSPMWFEKSFPLNTRTQYTSVLTKLPQNLHKSKRWMGFAVYASLVEDLGQRMKEETYYEVLVILIIGGKFGTAVSHVFQHVSPLSEEHHQLLVIYIPRAQVSEALFTQTLTSKMKFYIFIRDSPHVRVQRCGFRNVYQEDIQGFADTIIQCMQKDDSLETFNEFVVEEWIKLIRLQGAHLERMTNQDSRTPQKKQFEIYSQKYRNWDWSAPRPVHCIFERVEISKLKWFMPFINQGNSAEIQLPLNVFHDDNWLGFAVCSRLPHDQHSLGSTAPDSKNVGLTYRLDSDVAWHGLFDFSASFHGLLDFMAHANIKKNKLLEYDVTLFFYLPRTVLSKMWRQCKLARITMRFSSPCLAVHGCALRLLFKEDVEHLVETLTLASAQSLRM